MLISLTPVKNEAWILQRFLRCASLWADRCIVADQGSTDQSQTIAREFSKANVVENKNPSYDEGARQKLLIDLARAIPAEKRILIALDADEFLTANWSASPEWQSILSATPGTVLYFDWVNILPGFEKCWIPSKPLPLGIVDDGAPHSGQPIHSTRIPVRPGAPSITLRDIKVLHYQYTNWERMESKQRWYQCWEKLNHPTKRPIQIFRQYRGMYSRPQNEIHPFRHDWIDGYQRAGIDMTDVGGDEITWWDREIIDMLLRHGPSFFRRQDIWTRNWPDIASSLGHNGSAQSLRDPRTSTEKRIHQWLHDTQPRCSQMKIRWTQRALRLIGW